MLFCLIVLTAASVANACTYCVAAHTAGLKAVGLAEDEIQRVREGRPLADARLEALRRFTTTLVERRGWPDKADLEQFFAHGYRREQIFEVLVGVAMKTLSNYANHIAGTPLDRPLEAFRWEPTAEPVGR